MQFNWLAIIIATIVQFGIAAVWYTFLFGKLWGKIHGFDKLPKETQERLVKEIGPFYPLQALITLITSVVLAIFITNLPGWNPYAMAGFFWIGFVVPAQVSNVIFGGIERKWVLKKIAVQAGASLVCLEAAAAIIFLMQ
jgi:hypothetical protein